MRATDAVELAELFDAVEFGGSKNSGHGRELGGMGIQKFVNKKLVHSVHLPAPT